MGVKARLREWWGWLVAVLLLLVGSSVIWKRKKKVRAAMKAFEAKKKVIEAERKAAIRNQEIDEMVKDARSTGSLADRFNE